MKKKIPHLSILILLLMGLSACTAPMTAENPEVNPVNPTDESTAMPVQPGSDSSEDDTNVVIPAWFSQELKDINSGEVFKISDFNGKVILVETMAVWCPKCLTQQKEISRFITLLSDNDDFVSIGIDIDPNENETLLSSHVEKYGFQWIFAIASKAVIDEIGAIYGAQYLNPPATPMLIIDKQGEQHQLPFGIKSAEELQKALEPFLDPE